MSDPSSETMEARKKVAQYFSRKKKEKELSIENVTPSTRSFRNLWKSRHTQIKEK